MSTCVAQPDPAHVDCAPLSGWRQMLADTFMVGSSTLFCHALGAVTSLLLRAWMDPALMGIWQALKTFLAYGNYTNLGISKGATQELAQARGSGNTAAAERSLHLAHTVNTLSSLLFAIVLMGIAGWILSSGTGPWSATWAGGLLAVGLLSMLQRHVTFEVTILRAKQRFSATARLSLLEALLTLVASAAGIWCLGLPGLYVATAVVLLASLHFLRKSGVHRLHWAWDLSEIGRLIGIGGPILLAGVASSLFRSLDKLMILGYLEDREYQLGCYSVALMVSTQLYGFANMLSTVMGPRYSELLGHSQCRREVARLAARASEMQAAALALPAALALVAAPPLLRWMLPEYEAGLLPLVWLIPGLLAAGMALPASQYLIAVNQGGRVLGALLLATSLAAAGNHWVLTHGGGLTGVAIVTTGANFVYLLVLIALSLWPRLASAERWRYALVLLGTLGSNLLLLPACTAGMISLSGNAAVGTFCGLAVISIWASMVWIAWWPGGWSKSWKHGTRNTSILRP